MTDDLSFVEFHRDELSTVADLLTKAFQEMTDTYLALGYSIDETFEEYLAEFLKTGFIRVAKSGGEIVGVTTYTDEDPALYLSHVGVRPDKFGNGLGSWMIARMEALARKAGRTELKLHTPDYATANLRLYERLGFEETHRAPPTHGRDKVLRVYMVKVFR